MCHCVTHFIFIALSWLLFGNTMTSKQQSSSESSQSARQSLIFVNVDLHGNNETLLTSLRRLYSGIEGVVKLYLQESDGKLVHAIRIDVKSDKFAEQFIGQNEFRIFNEEYSIETLPKSFIVSKVGSNEKLGQILQDLTHNYLGIERIFRFYDEDNKAVDHIRIDFKSESSAAKIVKDKYIFIDGKRRPIQPYWSLIHRPNTNENSLAAEQSQKPVTEQSRKPVTNNSRNYLNEKRVKELFLEQQMQLKAMIDQFEKKWDTRLASLSASSNNGNANQLTTIINELSMVCQQFNHQNGQIQKQLGSIVHRVQDTQTKLNGERAQQPIQNGH